MIVLQPISQNNPNLYKGPSSSEDFNKLRNDMHYDLTNLFNIANMHESEIEENMNLLLKENFFLQCKILDIEKLAEQIEVDEGYRYDGVSKKRLIQNFYTLDGLSDGDREKQTYINTLHGYASIPSADNISKLTHTASDGSVITPQSLKVSVLESNNTANIDPETGEREYYSISDSNIKRAFDGDRSTYWIHQSTFSADSGVSEVYGSMHIQLPLDTINDVYANHLTIHPFPEYSMSIRDILVRGHGERWRRLENYPTEQNEEGIDVPVKLESVGKMTFAFQKAEITEVQIKFSQPHWFMTKGRREFTYGFQEIDLSHRIVNQTEAEFISEFSIEDTTRRFSVVEYPEVVSMKGTDSKISDLVEHRLYYNQDLTNEFRFGTEIMAPIQKIYIRTVIKKSGEIVPMLQQLNIDYEYRELEAF